MRRIVAARRQLGSMEKPLLLRECLACRRPRLECLLRVRSASQHVSHVPCPEQGLVSEILRQCSSHVAIEHPSRATCRFRSRPQPGKVPRVVLAGQVDCVMLHGETLRDSSPQLEIMVPRVPYCACFIQAPLVRPPSQLRPMRECRKPARARPLSSACARRSADAAQV